jgi:hypothetical protein
MRASLSHLLGATVHLEMPNRRPRLELRGSSASPEEAAAVIAAVEQFLRDTVPPAVPVPAGPPAWQRAAILEGVGREPDTHPWM